MIKVIGRMLCVPEEERKLGFVADHAVEIRQFLVINPQMEGFTFKLDLKNGSYTDVIELQKTVYEDSFVLTWQVSATNLQYPGRLWAQLRAFSESGEVWHSQMVTFEVADSINAPAAFPAVLPSEFETFEQEVREIAENIEKHSNSVTAAYVEGDMLYIETSDGRTLLAGDVRGEQGPKGDTGPQGPQGEKGDKGETGEAGYTPQRGTDYWTDADKAEIRAYVDEAILGGAW